MEQIINFYDTIDITFIEGDIMTKEEKQAKEKILDDNNEKQEKQEKKPAVKVKKTVKKKKINKEIIITSILLLIFIIYTLLVKFDVFDKLDDTTASTIIGLRNDKLTNIMIAITNLSGAYALIAFTFVIILIAIIKNKRLPLNTMINLICAYSLGHIMKLIIRRPRPTGIFLTHANGFSYPSGHTIVGYAFYTFLAISMCERINSKGLKLLIRLTLLLLTLVIAFSRVYLGVHHLTDVIGGYLLGIAYLYFFLYIREKGKKLKNEGKKE